MCLRFVMLLASTLLVLAREQAGANGPVSAEALRTQLTAHIAQERFRGAEWGIKIAAVETGVTVFEANAEKLLKPASNAKLYTGALALDVLGADYKIRTSLYATNLPQNGVLSGDLIVYGRGDPSFSAAFGNSNALSRVVEAIRQTGIRQIDGDLVGDSTFFSGAPYGSSWTWDDLQFYYGAEASALCAQDNVIDLLIRPGERVGAPCRIANKAEMEFVELINRTTTTATKTRPFILIERPPGANRAYLTGSLPKDYGTWNDAVSVSNAPLWFVTLLKAELARAGIAVKGVARVLAWPANLSASTASLKELGSIASPEVGVIVCKMMKASQNLYAQLLLLQVGASTADQQSKTTEELGLQRLQEFVQRAAIPPAQVLLDDGAGLSRTGLVTPAATVQLLRYMATHKAADVFRASLPEAGTDGTLRTRLKELKGRLRAKTGTIRYVSTLSGYLTTKANEELAFSIMLNAYAPPAGTNNKDEVDAIARLVAELSDCTCKSEE